MSLTAISMPATEKTPHILIADFTKPHVTYRVAADHARKHDELITIARSIFIRSPQNYNAHLHFHTLNAPRCEGRAAEELWDEGWYFAPEFLEEGKLMVYVHFERWSLMEKIEMAKKELCLSGDEELEENEAEVERLRGLGDEKAEEGKWWDAVGWWKMAGQAERKIKAEESDKSEVDHEPKARKTGLPEFVKNEISEIVKNELAEAITIDVSENMKHIISNMVQEKIREIIDKESSAFAASANKRRRTMEDSIDTSSPFSENSVDHSKLPWPIYYPSQIPAPPNQPEEVMTVDAYSNTRYMYRDIIVGRAQPEVCAVPNIRPLVRATLVNFPQGLAIYTFMPAKFSKDLTRQGELQIPLFEVEYMPELLRSTEEESKANIRALLIEKGEGRLPERWEYKDRNRKRVDCDSVAGPSSMPEIPEEYTIIDTYAGTNYLDWDVIIGRAHPNVCADPTQQYCAYRSSRY